jgi:hypothetical protein
MTEDHKPSVGKIEKVESMKGWEKVDEIMTPLGAIVGMYSKTLAYRIEVKRLDVEIVRIKEQAAIAHNVINSTYNLKMEELNNRRLEITSFHKTVRLELKNSHIERSQVLMMAMRAQNEAFKSNITIEDKKNLMAHSLALTQELATFGKNAIQSLEKLVQSLPEINSSHKLLGE